MTEPNYDHIFFHVFYDPAADFYDRAADQILATRPNPKLKRFAPRPVSLERRTPKRGNAKKALRRAVDNKSYLVWGDTTRELRSNARDLADDLWEEFVRPALAAAYADGAEAGADNLAACCGCSGDGPITNPYDGSEFRP